MPITKVRDALREQNLRISRPPAQDVTGGGVAGRPLSPPHTGKRRAVDDHREFEGPIAPSPPAEKRPRREVGVEDESVMVEQATRKGMKILVKGKETNVMVKVIH